MEIYIKSHTTIRGLLKANYRKFDSIVYTNHDCIVPQHIKTRSKDCLHIPADDMDDFDCVRAPTIQQISNILDWSKNRDKLVCCCFRGVSRSSATAYVIACREQGPEVALTKLVPYRHWPNRLIVYYGSIVLGMPEIWDTFVNWQGKTGLDPSRKGSWPPETLAKFSLEC